MLTCPLRCGFDSFGRPVMYSTFTLIENRSTDQMVEHMIQVRSVNAVLIIFGMARRAIIMSSCLNEG